MKPQSPTSRAVGDAHVVVTVKEQRIIGRHNKKKTLGRSRADLSVTADSTSSGALGATVSSMDTAATIRLSPISSKHHGRPDDGFDGAAFDATAPTGVALFY